MQKKLVVMNEIKSNEWFNWKLNYNSYLNVMKVYIKFHKIEIWKIYYISQSFMKYTLNFMYMYTNILFSYKYIKFNVMSWN